MASVVPRQRTALREMTDRWFKVDTVIVEPGVRTGMPILYDNPKEVGADRIADAVAAFERYGGPTIVVDFGTATTFEVVSEQGRVPRRGHLPGIEISLEALSAGPPCCPGSSWSSPAACWARTRSSRCSPASSTASRPRSTGCAGASRTRSGPCTVVATGGLAGLIGPYSAAIDHHEPWLTLDGLRIIFGRNER